MRTTFVFCSLLTALIAAPAFARAQEQIARSSIGAAIGAVNFDVDGVATTVGISVRGSVAVAPRLAIEANLLRVKDDDELFESTMWAIEGQVHYYWRAGSRLRPYAGGGAGLFINDGAFVTDKSLTLSAAAGLRADLNDRVSLLGEFRLRSVEIDFAGSLAEVWGGLTINVGR